MEISQKLFIMIIGCGALATVGMAVTLVRHLRAEKRREAVLAGVALASAVATFALGSALPLLHRGAAVITLAALLYSARGAAGPTRAIALAASLAWILAILAARTLFG